MATGRSPEAGCCSTAPSPGATSPLTEGAAWAGGAPSPVEVSVGLRLSVDILASSACKLRRHQSQSSLLANFFQKIQWWLGSPRVLQRCNSRYICIAKARNHLQG